MSARSLNKTQLIGNLTRDPELRYTPQGTPVCTFGVATNREWTDQNGQKQEETEFHRIVAWQKLAELCSQLLFKGRKVYVDGRLQTRKWTGSDNQERQTTEVVIDNMIILDSRRKEEGEGVVDAGGVKSPVQSSPPVVMAEKTQIEKDAGAGAKASQPRAKTVSKPSDDKKTKKGKKEEVEKAETDNEEVKADDIPF